MSTHSPEIQRGKITSASGFAVICLLLFSLVVMTTFLAMMLFPADGESDRQLVAEFSGHDDGVTETFVVDDLWEFRWEHNGRLKRITWTRSDGEQDMFMEMPAKPIREQGGINYGEGGEYKFRVEGKGDWKIRVYQF